MQTHPVKGKGVDEKRLLAYLKKSRRTSELFTQRWDEEIYLVDHLFIARLPILSTLSAWMPSEEGQTMRFDATHAQPMRSGINYATTWNNFTLEKARAHLVPTPWLYQAGSRLYRKFSAADQERTIWLDKELTDLLAPDPDGLSGYRFELIVQDMVRVGASNGWCVCLSPARIKERESPGG